MILCRFLFSPSDRRRVFIRISTPLDFPLFHCALSLYTSLYTPSRLFVFAPSERESPFDVLPRRELRRLYVAPHSPCWLIVLYVYVFGIKPSCVHPEKTGDLSELNSKKPLPITKEASCYWEDYQFPVKPCLFLSTISILSLILFAI